MTVRRLLLAAAATASLVSFAEGPPPPEGAPPHPPREAFTACEGKGADAACTFTVEGRTVNGTCFTPAATLPLACRPQHAPPPRQR